MVQVFIVHSSKDKWIINPISQLLNGEGVNPYLSELDSPKPLSVSSKIEQAIGESAGVFVVWTHNVAEDVRTRDTVIWEIATAHKHKKPIYVFREKDVDVPMMVNYITDYFTFDPFNQETLKDAMQRVRQIGFNIKQAADLNKAVVTLFLIVFGVIVIAAAAKK